MIEELKKQLQIIEPISLNDMAKCMLLNRIDTKYICTLKLLPSLLKGAQANFNVQTENNQRIFAYESLYFDTPEMKTYFDHHQGKRIRYKIRFRKYLDSGDSFLEVKRKLNYTRTDKQRKKFALSESMSDVHLSFLKSQILVPECGFTPIIWTYFDRITLAGKNYIERVTIDLNIRFKSDNKEVAMPNLVIVEVKQNKSNGPSPFSQILKDLKVRPLGLSKYLLGNIMLNPDLKHNRYVNKLHLINKMCYDTGNYN